MADQKISQLTDGNNALATDEFVVARSGGNFRIDGASVAAAATSIGTLTSLTVTGTATIGTLAATNITGGVQQSDIGSAPNEIPLNQYLGTMAFQDATFPTVGQLQRSYVVLATNTAVQALGTNFATEVGIDADTTLTTTVPVAGTEATVVIVAVGASSRTVTFGTGFASTGTLATGTTATRRFVVRFISDGTRLLEVSRTTAITV
jgi:hypothetical protein